jgi:hypothetical protein
VGTGHREAHRANRSFGEGTLNLAIRKTHIINLLSNCVIFAFALFLIFGNLLRVIDFGDLFKHHILITEFFLYAFSLLLFPFVPLSAASFIFLSILCIGIFSSSLYGAAIQGFDIVPLFYAIRLILMILSSMAVGFALYRKYSGRICDVFSFLFSCYFKFLILSYVIYFLFWSSSALWQTLSVYGIRFTGDPHKGRFVSAYFDPNFYGALACIPCLLGYGIKKMNPAASIWKKEFLFILSIFLTWSRSGIATFMMLCGVVFFDELLKRKRLHLTFRHAASAPIFLISVLLIFYIKSEEAHFFIDRFLNMNEDPSALGRWGGFINGVNVFLDQPLLGIGFNFLPYNFVDSSLVITLATFGLIFSLIVFLIALFCIWDLMQKSKRINPEARSTFKYFVFYIGVVFLFSSQFNNLIYYTFWFIPIFSLLFYFRCLFKIPESFIISTASFEPKTFARGASGLIRRLFLGSCRS